MGFSWVHPGLHVDDPAWLEFGRREYHVVAKCPSIAHRKQYRIVTQYFVSKACQRQESTASFSAITCAAIGAGLLFASGVAASGLGEMVSNEISFAVQGSGVLAMAFAALE